MKKIISFFVLFISFYHIHAEERIFKSLFYLEIKNEAKKVYEETFIPLKMIVKLDNSIDIYPGYCIDSNRELKIDSNNHFIIPEFSKPNIRLVFKKFYYITDSIDEKIYNKFIVTLDSIVSAFERFYYEPFKTYSISFTLNALTDFTSSEGGAFSSKGGIGVKYRNQSRNEFGLIGTISTNRDTMISQAVGSFARTILTPGVRSFSVMANFRLLRLLGDNWGIGGYLNTTPMFWLKYPKKEDTIPSLVSVLPTTVELYFTYVLSNSEYDPLASPPSRINFDFGFVVKSLGKNLDIKDRQLFLGSNQDFFPGLIFGIDVHYSVAKFYFYFTYLPNISQPEIDGLTGFQITSGISLRANL